MQDQTSKIKEVLPNASIKDNSLSIFAHTNAVSASEMERLLPLGFQSVKRSGAGITLTFKMSN